MCLAVFALQFILPGGNLLEIFLLLGTAVRDPAIALVSTDARRVLATGNFYPLILCSNHSEVRLRRKPSRRSFHGKSRKSPRILSKNTYPTVLSEGRAISPSDYSVLGIVGFLIARLLDIQLLSLPHLVYNKGIKRKIEENESKNVAYT